MPQLDKVGGKVDVAVGKSPDPEFTIVDKGIDGKLGALDVLLDDNAAAPAQGEGHLDGLSEFGEAGGKSAAAGAHVVGGLYHEGELESFGEGRGWGHGGTELGEARRGKTGSGKAGAHDELVRSSLSCFGAMAGQPELMGQPGNDGREIRARGEDSVEPAPGLHSLGHFKESAMVLEVDMMEGIAVGNSRSCGIAVSRDNPPAEFVRSCDGGHLHHPGT
jgi:hypothetical protein